MRYSTLTTPIGELLLVADDDGALTAVHLPGRHGSTRRLGARRRAARAAPAASSRSTSPASGPTFDLPLRPAGAPFQLRVWERARCDPLRRDGLLRRDRARARRWPDRLARAVGAANGRNPIAIVVPCHRVIGSNGSLTGYAGGLDQQARAARPRGRARGAGVSKPTRCSAATGSPTRAPSQGPARRPQADQGLRHDGLPRRALVAAARLRAEAPRVLRRRGDRDRRRIPPVRSVHARPLP